MTTRTEDIIKVFKTNREKIQKLLDSDMSLHDIGIEIGVSYHSVRKYTDELKFNKRPNRYKPGPIDTKRQTVKPF